MVRMAYVSSTAVINFNTKNYWMDYLVSMIPLMIFIIMVFTLYLATLYLIRRFRENDNILSD